MASRFKKKQHQKHLLRIGCDLERGERGGSFALDGQVTHVARGTSGALWKSEWQLTCRLTPSVEVVKLQ